jgi:hypothetical protein
MKAMEFTDNEEKRRFTQTLINDGLQAAKEQLLNKRNIVFRPGQTSNVLGEFLTLEQAQAQYPNVQFTVINRKIVGK